MNWTIRNKIIAIGVVSALALTCLQGIAFLTGHQIEGSVSSSADYNEQIDLATSMRIANVELLLAAMDSIIDKDEGQIQPERKEVIAASIEMLKKKGARLLEVTQNEGDKDTVKAILAKIDPLAQGIQVDLARLIETNAQADEFAKIDDVIDEFGEGMSEALTDYSEKLSIAFEKSIVEVQGSLATARTGGTAAFLIAVAVLSTILFAVGKGIIGAVGGMTTAMRELASGNEAVEVPGVGRSDEIGEMADAVQVFKDNAAEVRRLNAEQEEREQRAEEQRHANAELALMKRWGMLDDGEMPEPNVNIRLAMDWLDTYADDMSLSILGTVIPMLEVALDGALLKFLLEEVDDPVCHRVFEKINNDESRHITVDFEVLNMIGHADVRRLAIEFVGSVATPGLIIGAVMYIPLLNRIRNEIVGMGLEPERLYNAVKRFRTLGERGEHTHRVPTYRVLRKHASMVVNPRHPYHLLANSMVWASDRYPKALLRPIPSWFKELTHEPAA